MDKRVAVIGAGTCDQGIQKIAFTMGQLLAQGGLTVLCGGLGGVMAAACQGAKAAGGRTIGILPSNDASTANPWVDIPIPTGMGEARNVILVNSAQALVAISGGYGTLSEIAFALRAGKPLIGLHSWTPAQLGGSDLSFPQAQTPDEVMDWLHTQLN